MFLISEAQRDRQVTIIRGLIPLVEMSERAAPGAAALAGVTARSAIAECEKDIAALHTLPEAPPAAQVVPWQPPAGYVLVPVEPTPEMVQAACALTCKECHGDCHCGPYAAQYRAMLAAAPVAQDADTQKQDVPAVSAPLGVGAAASLAPDGSTGGQP